MIGEQRIIHRDNLQPILMEGHAIHVANVSRGCTIKRVANPNMSSGAGRTERDAPRIHEVWIDHHGRVKIRSVRNQNRLAKGVVRSVGSPRGTSANQESRRSKKNSSRDHGLSSPVGVRRKEVTEK